MGQVRVGCRTFKLLSIALEWIAIHQVGCRAMVHILDDFLFIDKTYGECMQILQSFSNMCDAIGVPIAENKTFSAPYYDDFCWHFIRYITHGV